MWETVRMRTEESFVRNRIARSAQVIASLESNAGAIARMIDAIREALSHGRLLVACGNGGSAAEAMHLTEELIGRYRLDRPALPAICLNADPTALTCIANDFGFEQVFSRQVEALVHRGDVVVGFSTSGASENVRRAFAKGREQGAICIGLLGKGGGACAALCDHAIIVECDETEHIQEAHQVLVHLVLEAIETAYTLK